MPRDYLIRIETIAGGPDDLEMMRLRVEADLNDEEFRGYEFTVVDVQQIPRKVYTGREIKDLEGEQQFPSTSMKPFTAYPEDAPPHPWTQGTWIFPEDHPLSAIERLAHSSIKQPENRQAIQEEFLNAKAITKGGDE